MTPQARLLRLSPRLLGLALLLPVAGGLVGTLLPALEPGAFAALADWPGLPAAVALSLGTGLASTLIALTLAILITATLYQRPAFTSLRRALAPLLALPHAAAAIGLAFLLAPSGWFARALSPWATGWDAPPDLLILNDPLGLSLTFGLVAKELPFLLLVTFAALPQIDTDRRLPLARTLGYGEIAGFCLTVLPALYPSLRLAVLAVLSYAMTSVDMGAVLGPTRPPSLAVQITLWRTDPAQGYTALASAAAALQLALTLAALLLWRGLEAAAVRIGRALINGGHRLRPLDAARPPITLLTASLLLALLATIPALTLWSFATLWPWPDALPEGLTFATWTRAAADLATLSLTTLTIALTATAIALALCLAVLEAEHRFALPAFPPALLYLPLILPQVCFLPGLEPLALGLGASGGIASVTLAHLLFVLPYTYFILAGPFRAWDTRIATVAATMGASPARIFWRLRLPMLLAPLATAAAVGLAVSIGQYLPTLLVGGGRISTLTTEALALASGGNRRLTSAHALLQTLWPMLGFALALALPPLVTRLRFGKVQA